MNLTQYKSKFQLLFAGAVVIILILVIASAFSLLGGKKTEEEIPLKTSAPQSSPRQTAPTLAPNIIVPPQKSPESLPDDVKTTREKIIASQIANEQGDLLLYQSETYSIEYIPSPNVFFVKILKDPAQTAKKNAQSWFLNFGLAQSDLCDLPVRFILSTRELRETNPNFTSLPDGCTP